MLAVKFYLELLEDRFLLSGLANRLCLASLELRSHPSDLVNPANLGGQNFLSLLLSLANRSDQLDLSVLLSLEDLASLVDRLGHLDLSDPRVKIHMIKSLKFQKSNFRFSYLFSSGAGQTIKTWLSLLSSISWFTLLSSD